MMGIRLHNTDPSLGLNAIGLSGSVQKVTIHQVITMLASSENPLFPSHNHLLTTGTDDPTVYRPSASKGDNQGEESLALVVSRWL